MKILINSYNTLSAGTANVSKLMLESLLSSGASEEILFILPDTDLFETFEDFTNVRVVKLPVHKGLIKALFRIALDFIYIPILTFVYRYDATIIMANYSPMIVRGKKIVMMRHSYLVDDTLFAKTGLLPKLIETIRRILFTITLKTTNNVIVQSKHMEQMFLSKYNPGITKLHILPNPVTNSLNYSVNKQNNTFYKFFFYASRFYPHKNHVFLKFIVEKYQESFREKFIKFYITIDPNIDIQASYFLEELRKDGLDDIIINIGEVPQEMLSEFYASAYSFIFPSHSESFGNPLVEAMGFGLPVLVPDLEYSKAVCNDAGIYYEHDNVDDAFKKICHLISDDCVYTEYSNRSLHQFKNYMTVEQWNIKVLDIASDM